MHTYKYSCFASFIFEDPQHIEARLNRMSAKGWMLDKTSSFYWRFVKSTPQEKKYAVTYFHEASEFNPYPTDNQQRFFDYCAESGWKLVSELAQIQIFCSDEENPTPIETDESLKLQTIHRSAKRNYIPTFFLIIAISLLQFFTWGNNFLNSPAETLADMTVLLIFYTYGLLFIHSVTRLIGYLIWYLRSKKSTANGGGILGTPLMRFFSNMHLVLLIVGLMCWIFNLQDPTALIFGIIIVFPLMFIAFAAKKVLKLLKITAKKARIIFVAVIFIATFTLLSTLIFIIAFADLFVFGNRPVETILQPIANDQYFQFNVYDDDIPLRLEDFTEADAEHYSYRLSTDNESPFASYIVARQTRGITDEASKELRYNISYIKFNGLYNFVKSDYLAIDEPHDPNIPPEFSERFEPYELPDVDAEIYRFYYDANSPSGTYVACFANVIAEISFDNFDPTESEMTNAINLLYDNVVGAQ